MRHFTLAGCCALFLLSSPALADGIKLIAVRFPAQIDGKAGTQEPPTDAPLSQRIVFEFDGVPQMGPGIAEGLRIRVDSSNTAGQPIGGLAFGTYAVSGNKVLFTPRLPVAPITTSFGTTTDVAGNVSLPGLLPDTTYAISVTIDAPNSVKNLKNISKTVGLPVKFKTIASAPLFYNASPDPVEAKKDKLTPAAGATGIHPNVFHDPAGLFTAIDASKHPPFKIVFDAPVNSAADNIAAERIRLRAILTPDGAAEDIVIGGTPLLVKNKVKRAEVLLYPSGILPLGHTIALEVSNTFESLGGVQIDSTAPDDFQRLAEYRVALDPQPGTAVDDYLYEDFDTTSRQDTSIAAAGEQLASWDAADSNVLKASFGFGGDGSLGRFLPPTTQPVTIYLDTNYQAFPLFSGSTPDVEPGTAVVGGVFNFTDFHLPSLATIVARGSNPLIITATGNVVIEGEIDLNGSFGTGDDTFDSAITPMPGGSPGPGGGKGGDGHPVKSLAGASSLKFMQTPQYAQSGYGPGNKGPGGGGGGQCGCTLPWISFTPNTCTGYAGTGDGSRGSGGGGGSFGVFYPDQPTLPMFPAVPEPPGVAVSGRRGTIGIGNHLPVAFKPSQPIPSEPGAYQAQPGNPTNAVAMANPNPTFTQAYQQGMIYDIVKTSTGTDIAFKIDLDWPKTHKITLYGNAGPGVFVDEDPDNNFIGSGGEVSSVIGGQGGGGAGSRTEGLDQDCKVVIFNNAGYPFTVLDARGGGGGAGGGAMLIQALGTIEIRGSKAKIEAKGGDGGGGEGTQDSSRGGGGGGGSGGAVILQSAANVIMNDTSLQGEVIDVSGGCGDDAINMSTSTTGGVAGADSNVLQCFDGGPGGPGIVQIHVPAGAPNMIDTAKIIARVSASVQNMACSIAVQKKIDPLVPMERTPTPLTPGSMARSVWYDLGAVTSDFRPPVITGAGALEGPLFGIPGVGPFFKGTDPNAGEVLTDSLGYVVEPFLNDIAVDAPDSKLLLPDFIPNGPSYFQSVAVLFEGADADPQNPGAPDLTTATGFVSDISLLNGRRFVRWEIRFDIATNPSFPPQPETPRPQVNFLRVPFKY